MKIDIPELKRVVAMKDYKWFDDKPNLIAVRTALQVPDVFNDLLFVVWKQQEMPKNLSPKSTQRWLNQNLFRDADGNILSEDGDFGEKTRFAINTYNQTVGKERIHSSIITTEPGITYQKKLLNEKGCWIMMPAQMIDAYTSGFHQGKSDHRCLKSTGKIFGLREDDKDGIALNDKDAVATWVDGTTIGANIHGANKTGETSKIGPWSAGCQVHNRWSKKEEMMDIVDSYGKIKITYTLLEEKDFS